MITEREIAKIISKQYEFFNTCVTHSYEFRINELQKLKKKIKKFENQFNAALKKNIRNILLTYPVRYLKPHDC